MIPAILIAFHMTPQDIPMSVSAHRIMNVENKSIETREFSVDKNILYDLFFKQFHSVEGAILELIQNSYDAGANTVDINIKNEFFEFSDNGRGFSHKSEITEWFEVFGAPRDKEDDALFGRYRMGRGQIMGMASTTWRLELLVVYLLNMISHLWRLSANHL